MKTILIPIITALSLNISAQSDEYVTNDGTLKIHPLFHSTMVLEWNGKTIYIDPYSGAEKFEKFPKPDLILITDVHFDHLDKKTLEGLNTSETTFIVPQAVKDQLDVKSKEVVVINNGEKKSWGSTGIEAVPMYNLPEADDAFHNRGRGNGYVLTIGGKRIYISGDTGATPEMRGLKNIDIAFICMNLPYTMDINQAAEGVLAFKPKVVYPFHTRNEDGSFSDVKKFKELVSSKNKNIEVRLRDWYPQ